MIRETTRKLSASRTGGARFWADGKYLRRAGFLPGMFLALSAANGQVSITPSEAPTKNRVSAKEDGAKPVIDITGEELQRLFGPGVDVVVRIEEGRILISEAALAKRIAERKRDGTVGSVFTGGGLADAAMTQAGLRPIFGVEIDERYANMAQANHPTMAMYHMSAHEAAFANLPQCEGLFMGIPCEPWSMARRVEKGTGGKGKRDMSKPATAHPLGDMTLWAFAIALKVNPHWIVIEEAPAYAESETAYSLHHALERLGYVVTRTVVNANAHGGLTKRMRTCLIAQTPAADGTVPAPLPLPVANTRTVASLLDAEVPEDAWFDRSSKAWLFNHASKQAAKGNGFGFQVVDPNAIVMPVIKKRYLAGQGDSPLLAHPTRPDTYRWFTLTEIARFAGLPDTYVFDGSKITSGEIIGQGIDIPSWTRIIAQASGRGDGRRLAATRLTADEAEAADAAPVEGATETEAPTALPLPTPLPTSQPSTAAPRLRVRTSDLQPSLF